MTKLGKIVILGIVAATFSVAQVFVFPPDAVFACSCVTSMSQKESFGQAKAVFSGRVLSITTDSGRDFFGENAVFGHRKVKIQVLESWKGVNTDTVILATGIGGGDCGFDFQEGEEYLIYAYDGVQYREDLETGICQRTRLLVAAGEDLQALSRGKVFSEEPPGPLPAGQSRFREFVGDLMGKITDPITFTIFNAPWHRAFLILLIYIAPPVLFIYFLIKRFITK